MMKLIKAFTIEEIFGEVKNMPPQTRQQKIESREILSKMGYGKDELDIMCPLKDEDELP